MHEVVTVHVVQEEVRDIGEVDSDDDANDDGAPPPPPRQQLASETTSKELDVPGRGVGQSGAGFDGYNPSLEPEPPPDAAANTADAPAAAPARVTRGAAGGPHVDVLASHRAAVAPVTASATIAATDVGQPGAGFDGYIPSPSLELLPGAAASVADAAAVSPHLLCLANGFGRVDSELARLASPACGYLE